MLKGRALSKGETEAKKTEEAKCGCHTHHACLLLAQPIFIYMGWEASSSHRAKVFISRHTIHYLEYRTNCISATKLPAPAPAWVTQYQGRSRLRFSLIYGPGKGPLPTLTLSAFLGQKLHQAQEGCGFPIANSLRRSLGRLYRMWVRCQTHILVPKTLAV